MNFQRFLRKCLSAYYVILAKATPSFSQAGEDQVVRHLFEILGIDKPTYLDIGTNHPFIGNNTFYFYQRGATGVCIEPDPAYYSLIKKHRRRDVILQVGIGLEKSSEGLLYVFPDDYKGWNTFAKNEADSRQKESGIAIREIKKVPLETINSVIESHFNTHPNFLSIDIEGMDFDIIQSLDFNRFMPEVICIETIAFDLQNKGKKLDGIIPFLKEKQYIVFADTHINTIFCRADLYKKGSL